MKHRSLNLLALVTVGVTMVIGCSRGHYRLRADSDAYGRIIEKSVARPWQIPSDYNVYPAPNSRLHDETCVNDPRLPTPSPQLYEYDLPDLPERDQARFRPAPEVPPLMEMHSPEAAMPPSVSPSPPEDQVAVSSESSTDNDDSPFVPVSFKAEPGTLASEGIQVASQEIPTTDTNLTSPPRPDTARGPVVRLAQVDNEELPPPDEADSVEYPLEEESEVQTNQVPLPPEYWESIPPEFLARTFEFKSVRDEYARTYGAPPNPSQLDDSPKLALEDIIDLTLLNSRELQTEKEALFRVALVLTLERFDYQLRPSFGNNGSAANYTHNRIDGITTDRLRIPTTFQLRKMMYSGADFIGRFANDVLLTFNGPQGFAVDVGSELLFDFSQNVLQRDVRLENLTQAERNVVYAARDFTRSRKELFVAQATDYYSLIRQFRQIEIQCQNYFTLAREFNQRSVEIKYGMAARTQLDQVEQEVIIGRQSILSSITNLENNLDGLKIRMGIPTEQPLNIDLSELNLITLSDELAVNAELIERTRTRLRKEMASETRSPFVLLGAVAQLTEQMSDSLELRGKLDKTSIDSEPLQMRLMELRIFAADIDISEDRDTLELELNDEDPDPTKVVQRRRDVAQELSRKVLWQLRLLEDGPQSTSIPAWMAEYRSLGVRLVNLEDSFLQIIFREQAVDSEEDPDDLEEAEQELIAEAASLQDDLQKLADELDVELGRTAADNAGGFEARAVQFATELMVESESFRQGSGGGLVPIEIEMDDAMMTALVQRFDLMNQRGFLADDWRQIKYAADDLRSILNLNAAQSIRTRSRNNEPFDFTFEDSTTSVGMSLDLPFNRRAQRNRFRTSLFDYQQTLRNVTQLEDTIKLAIRRDLRTLELDRQQYANDVAGAALASERVTGTELEVRGGFATSRDYLESQQAYVQSISGVASDHISYIVTRLNLFLDLESLTVGDNGFWDELYDENHQPEPYYQLPGYARPGYGELHPCLKYSKMIRRMRGVPDGVSMVHDVDRRGEQQTERATEEQLEPALAQ